MDIIFGSASVIRMNNNVRSQARNTAIIVIYQLKRKECLLQLIVLSNVTNQYKIIWNVFDIPDKKRSQIFPDA